jgi:small ligand-binding sensory domain FIST
LPINKARRVTQSERNLVIELDGQPALDVLLKDLNVSLEEPAQALQAVRATLVGLMRQAQASAAVNDSSPVGRTGNFGPDVIVRHIIGLDPTRRGLAVADLVAPGMQLAFCQRNAKAARADLMRICAEIREELEPEELPVATVQALGVSELEAAPHPARRIAGAVYVSCSGRGGPHFGGASAELQIVRHALGDVPLVGFFAGGEIARNHVYGYTGVLTVFTGD